ncbi:hypothetical protein JJD41_00710 [Oxynema sp. CENA135]|jgi:hypothetical protein|uniref:Uncharacterized protein n=1 Tax=Oxynema aestuarii AP17 TaxID=2064643 RepID=A0A6H1TXH7_9CYAN|nr:MULTISPECIES: hypothetical protein [Oxynema]MBK4728413.1 hypothetical protein [Oxynema sp. CENA135]QIZ70059.1 hypothetical protein HCG48_05320 [Oxynema aestuarii AP17]RMH78252.1 MAG: hypothetical protein D6680_02695 [Cyanobacteria bacterium J007]
MRPIKFLGWAIASCVLVGTLASLSAIANPPNQSDITGTHIWNNTVPQLGGETSSIDPQVLARASELASEIDSAKADYEAAERAAAEEPRRFARRQSRAECVNPYAERLNRLVEEARVFLDSIDEEQANILRGGPESRPW